MEKEERRKNRRCQKDTEIVFSFFNQTEQHAAVARNYSRFGMYFESDRPLGPGATIVIRTMGSNPAESRYGGKFERVPADDIRKDTQLPAEACRELKTLVVAEVKHCENCKDLIKTRYGVGVHCVSPAV